MIDFLFPRKEWNGCMTNKREPQSNDFDYNIPSQYSFDMLVPRLGW